MLKKTWHSTRALHQRFNISPPPRVASRNVFREETRELIEAAKVIDAIEGSANRAVDDLIEPRIELELEAADVIVTVLGLCMAYGGTYRGLKRALKAVQQKNDAKTHDSHEINRAGKIARKAVTPVTE